MILLHHLANNKLDSHISITVAVIVIFITINLDCLHDVTIYVLGTLLCTC